MQSKFLFRSWPLLCCFLLLIGCKTEPSTDTAVELGREENTLILQMDGEPDMLNPITTTSGFASFVCNQIFSYLVWIEPETLELKPTLAKAMPTIAAIEEGPYAGGLSYTFNIHDEAVWDDGSPVTGHDYIFTLKAALNPNIPAQRVRSHLTLIKDVEVNAENPKEFTVFTSEKFATGKEHVSSTLPLMPAYVYDPNQLLAEIPLTDFTDEEKIKGLAETDDRLKQFATAFLEPKFARDKGFVVGAGPYTLEKWETGQAVELIKKENWWGDQIADKYPTLAAYPDKIIFRPNPNAAAVSAAIKEGIIDIASNFNPKDFLELEKVDFVKNQYDFHRPLSLVSYFIYVNTENPKLNDKRVRKAIAHSINVDEIIENLYYDFGSRNASPVHPSVEYYNDQLQPPAFDIEKAKALLKEAGWEDSNQNGIVDKEIDGEQVELSLKYMLTSNRELSRKLGLNIQSSAKKAGIDIQLDPMEINLIFQNLKGRTYELGGGGRALSPTIWEPRQSWHTLGDNRTGFGNAETDQLIEAIQVELDKDKRNQMYKELQAIIHEEQPEIYLFVPQGRIISHKRFNAPTSAYFPGYFPNLVQLKSS